MVAYAARTFAMARKLVFAALYITSLVATTLSLDNGVAVTPPMGFRTWNQFGLNVNSSMMLAIYRAMASRTRLVDGKPTSLVDLGYTHAGIDDGWQLCQSGPNGKGFHNASGFPNVDTQKFPDMRALTAAARSYNVTPGWYANNCHCSDHSSVCTSSDSCYIGDVQATVHFGFAGLKVDGCSFAKNFSEYAPLFNQTGTRVLLENCHEGKPKRLSDGTIFCPMNLFRTSGDIRPTYGAIIRNLLTVDEFNNAGLSGPSCWAYPDMLEVGVTHDTPPGALHHCQKSGIPCKLNAIESQTHFSAWAITSAPLILGMDLTDEHALDSAWPIIANPEVISVNQLFAGDAGIIIGRSLGNVEAPNCGSGNPCEIPGWLVYAKRLPVDGINNVLPDRKSASAILLINNAEVNATITANLSAVAGLGSCNTADGCTVRDVVARTDRARFTGTLLSDEIAAHASVLLVVSSSNPAPPVPPPSPPTPGPGPSPSSNCHWISGAGLKGGDIMHTDALTKEACCGLCLSNPRCKAACFRPANHTGTGAKGCHLKAENSPDPGGAGDADAIVCIPTKV